MRHTPGPWAVENDEDTLDQWFIREPEGGIVAVLEKGPNEEIQDRQYDNARLIAAAPDLVDAIQFVADALAIFQANRNEVCITSSIERLHQALTQVRGDA